MDLEQIHMGLIYEGEEGGKKVVLRAIDWVYHLQDDVLDSYVLAEVFEEGGIKTSPYQWLIPDRSPMLEMGEWWNVDFKDEGKENFCLLDKDSFKESYRLSKEKNRIATYDEIRDNIELIEEDTIYHVYATDEELFELPPEIYKELSTPLTKEECERLGRACYFGRNGIDIPNELLVGDPLMKEGDVDYRGQFNFLRRVGEALNMAGQEGYTKEEFEKAKERAFGTNDLGKKNDVTKEKTKNGGDNMLKTTIEGKLAVRSNDGFYYSVGEDGSLKREYTVYENISDPVERERVSLKLGDILNYEGVISFCSAVTGNQYSITSFLDKTVRNIQKGDETDDLGIAYRVYINPIKSILDSDPNANAVTLLSNNPDNAQRIAISLQQNQSSALDMIAKSLANLNKGE